MGKGKDLGGREPPLERGGLSPSKPPSLTENFPQEHPSVHGKELFRFVRYGCSWGKFFVSGGRCFFESAAVALVLWVRGTICGLFPADCASAECVTYQTAPIKKRGVVGNDLCVVPLRGMLLVNGYTIPYTSAEIPPAGAPAGFDSAATVGFSVCHRTVVPLRSE